jgi:hypothetical protein
MRCANKAASTLVGYSCSYSLPSTVSVMSAATPRSTPHSLSSKASRPGMRSRLRSLSMACTHSAAMSILARLGPATGAEEHVCRFASAASPLLRAYTTQCEAYRRLRHGGDQFVRVEHVHISDLAAIVFATRCEPRVAGVSVARSSVTRKRYYAARRWVLLRCCAVCCGG